MSQNPSRILIPSSDIETAKTTFVKAKDFLAQKDYEQAIPLLKQVIGVFEADEEWELFMEASYELVVACRGDFFLSELNEIFEYALKIQEEKCPHLFMWKVRLYVEKALSMIAKPKQILQCLHKAQQIMESKKITNDLYVYIIIHQVDPYTMCGDYPKAQQLLEKASELLEKEVDNNLMAEFYSRKAWVEFCLSNYKSAQQNYEKAYELYSPNNIHKKISCYNSIGTMCGVLGDREKELTYYLKSIDFYKNAESKKDKYMLAIVHLSAAKCYRELEDFLQALYYYENALALFEEIMHGVDYYRALTLTSLGQLFSKFQNYSKQIEYLGRALVIGEKVFGKRHEHIAVIYYSLADAHKHLGELNKALAYSQKCLKQYEALLGENHLFTFAGEYLMGWILILKGNYSEGLKFLNKALEGIQNKHGNTHPMVRGIQFHIATHFHQQGKLENALEKYQLALIASLPRYEETDYLHLPQIEECTLTGSGRFCNILFGKARVLYDYFCILKQEDSIKAINVLKASFNTCKLLIVYMQKVQKNLKIEDSKLFFAKESPSICQLCIKVSLHWMKHKKNNSILEQAFAFHEFEKSFLLRSSMQENEAKIKASIPSNLLKQEKELKEQIETYLQKIEKEEAKGAKKGKMELEKWKQKHFNSLQKHQTLIEELEQDYPQYLQFKYEFESVSVTNLQQNLDEQTIVLSYFIGPEMAYIFVVTRDDYEVISFEVPTDFDQQIKDYLSSIHAQNFGEFTRQSYDLYCLLIQPIEDLIFDPFEQELKKLVIIPSASLNYLPFETLIRQIPETSTPIFHQLEYLLQKFQIQYHYSATLYHQSLKQEQKKPVILNEPTINDSIDFMGFAPIYTSDKEATQEVLRNLASDYSRWATRSEALQNDTLAPLPFSEKEVQSIEALFAQKGFNGKSFLYDTATKDHFKTIAYKAKYLHIAAHGLSNDEYPKLSGIVFHPTENATEIHDSVLSMGEMYQLQLQADLVVLSSCESGIGKLARGEGMMAMNRGFLHAGAKNVIYTLFKVLDKPSSELCEALFEEILEGKPYGEALRLAKLALIQREDVDPKSWSGFVLLGV
ncbi:MAG: CHAT domain-containing protein [Chitinophagales bacterium]